MHKEVSGLKNSRTKESPSSACLNCKTDAILSMSIQEQMGTPTSECSQREGVNTSSYVQDDAENLACHMRKCQSLGCRLDKEGSHCDIAECEFKETFSCDDSNENYCGNLDSFDKCDSVDSFDPLHSERKHHDQDTVLCSCDESQDHMHHEHLDSLFSDGNLKIVDRRLREDSFEFHTVRHSDPESFVHPEPCILKSQSLNSLCLNSSSFLSAGEIPMRSWSFDDLCIKGTGARLYQSCKGPHIPQLSKVCRGLQNGTVIQSAIFPDHVDLSTVAENKSSYQADALENCASFVAHCSVEAMDQGCHAITCLTHGESVQLSDEYQLHNCSDSVDHSMETGKQDREFKHANQEENFQKWDELTCQELNMKRVQEWLSEIDIHGKLPSEQVTRDQCSIPVAKMDCSNGASAFKLDTKVNPGMEAAYSYISSLTAAATSAQMSCFGLVFIPFLGAFTNLRLLNLSGNFIVKITAGALPRGLHMLNLSRNNISTIEGMRDLTRLRVLDMSYNRILRIGHGLSACSSLKELYLAGNKISEVEGLHRLLKLAILDVSHCKISMTKCLGQLAANYASLQAINLDGNPAQRNVGDEQLRKYVQSLLPHLAYYNNHFIKVGSSKEASSSRSGTSHQFDRGLRSEQKWSRRGHHGSATTTSHKTSIPSSHGRQTRIAHAHAPLPPLKFKPGHPRIVDPKLRSLQLDNPIRRSRSTGNLG